METPQHLFDKPITIKIFGPPKRCQVVRRPLGTQPVILTVCVGDQFGRKEAPLTIDGATLIHLQLLHGVAVHPDHRVQGRRNGRVLQAIPGVVKGSRIPSKLTSDRPRTGTLFTIPGSVALTALTKLGTI